MTVIEPVGVCRECARPVHARGLCGTHYMQMKRAGRTKPIRVLADTIEQRLWVKVDRRGPVVRGLGRCWEWTGTRDDHGYGTLKFKGRWQKAHRVAWVSAHGPVPSDLDVLHRCDNPPCVRPSHLFLGTQADNNADMMAKGRQVAGGRRLDDEAIRAIVNRFVVRFTTGRDGPRTNAAELAAEFGVTAGHIRRVARRGLTPVGVRRVVDTHARHGFIYQLGDQWVVEHCVDGEWYACPLAVPADAQDRVVNAAAMRDLKRRPHRGPLAERLKGTHHR